MADKVKPADDPDIKAAVGYGFDASLRKGTQAGFAAMRGSSEYQKLDSKSKDFADELFRRRIDADTNLKQFKGIGDEKVGVYRKAAKEKPARVIDYKKEFGAKPKQSPKPAAKSAPTPSNSRAIGTGMSQMLNLSTPATKPAAKAAPAPKKSSTKTTTAAPIRKAMGMPAAPKSDKVFVKGLGYRDKDTAMRLRAFDR